MDQTSRDEPIDAYFEALDTGELARVRPYLADSFVYESLAGIWRNTARSRERPTRRRHASTAKR